MAVGYDVTYGNISAEEAGRLGRAALCGLPSDHVAGSTEPWVSRLVADFVIATGARSVLETGGYLGDTSAELASALGWLAGGRLTICEIDQARAAKIHERLTELRQQHPELTYLVHGGDVLGFLRRTDLRFDVAFVDDCHEEKHVREEMELLYPKMLPGGLVLMHDVTGLCPGNKYPLGRICNEFGGYVLPLPRLGPAGGLGVIAIPA